MSHDDAFVDVSETVDVIVYYKKDGRNILAINQEQFDTNVERGILNPDDFKIIEVQMRELNWGLYNEINEMAVFTNEEGMRNFNLKTYKEAKLLKLIKSWNISIEKNGQDRIVPVDANNLGKLHQNIVEAILSEYDRLSIISEEELKKLKSRHTPTT